MRWKDDFLIERLKATESHFDMEEPEAVDPFKHFRVDMVRNDKMTIHTCESDLKNPNILANISYILRRLALRVNIASPTSNTDQTHDSRQWVFCENDVGNANLQTDFEYLHLSTVQGNYLWD